MQTFSIEGPKLLKLKKFADNRGFFVERYKDAFAQELGIKGNFVQDNFSNSKKNVLRGLHYQHSPGQGKLVTCLSGEIFDVAVDIRKNSPTFGQHVSVVLNSEDPALFWIPAGFAHGFLVRSESADVMYKVDCLYNAKNEGSLIWNDPDLKINWGIDSPLLSDKDAVAPGFKEYSHAAIF